MSTKVDYRGRSACLLLVIFVVCGLLPDAAQAQTPCFRQIESFLADPASYESALRRSCIGDDSDREGNDLVTPVLDAMPPVGDAAISQLDGVTEALGLLIAAADGRANSGTLRTQWRQLGERLKRELAFLTSIGAAGDAATELPFMSRADFEVGGAGTAAVLGDFELYTGVENACPEIELNNVTEAVRTCAAFVDRLDLIRALRLSESVASYSTTASLVAHALDAKLALDRWDAYWNDARFQWWWEVGFNGARMEKQGHCKTNEDAVRIGFCDVPNSQWILFHPDVAFQWIDGAESSSQLHASGIVEIIGHNRWKWDGAEMTQAFGWSLVASYTNLSGQDNWGYGAMVHWRNKFSLGVTDTDGDLGVFVNANLSDLFFERKAKYQQYLKGLEKVDLTSVILGAN